MDPVTITGLITSVSQLFEYTVILTCYSSVIIDHLQSKTEQENAHVVFLYCSYRKQAEQTAVNLIRSLVRQMVERQSAISAKISNLYDALMMGGSSTI